MGSFCTRSPSVVSSSKSITKFSKVEDFKRKYEYLCMLGNGSFGKVRLYREKDCKDKRYAIKTIKKEGISKHNRQFMKEEVEILIQMDHPNIVKYFETYEDDFYMHIVMEYLAGDDLFKLISSKKYHSYSERDTVQIVSCLLKAVKFIHNKKIVHRDLKPENILFSSNGDYSSLKLIDFGLSTHFTEDGKSVGTPFYMAPEIINGSFSHKTDLWSVGVILYVLTTGKYPFFGKTKEEIFEKILTEEFDRAHLKAGVCSKQLRDLISKLLNKDEKFRPNVDEALNHPFFKMYLNSGNTLSEDHVVLQENILNSIHRFNGVNSFKKEVMFYVAKISSEKEVSSLKEIFLEMDTNNSGTLSFEEILSCFNKLGLKINKDEVNEIFDGLDFHKDGEVNYTEFLAATISSHNFLKEENIWSAFKHFESASESGYITPDSVIEALKLSDLKVNEESLRNYFIEFTKEGEQLDFSKFKIMVAY